MHRSLLIVLLLAGCGRPVTEADVKMAGVGLNPDEIGPVPEYYGGYVEYDWVNFAGGGLTLAALGLASTDEVGPGLTGFKPPYAAVYGLAFIFDEQVPAPDVHHGNIGVPPAVEDACWTNYEPFSFLMASTVEVGTEFNFESASVAEGDEMLFSLGRFPELYPPNPQDVFVYYSSVESWLQSPMTHFTPDGEGGLVEEVLRYPNFRHGATVDFSFPGGIPPEEAPVSAIPRSSASVQQTDVLALPSRASGLSLTWSGPTYSSLGGVVAESGEHATCVDFLGQAVESDGETVPECLTQLNPPNEEGFGGQIYTGPWDAEDGKVTFHWQKSSSEEGCGGGIFAAPCEGETVTLNIRFLGPVDRTDSSYLVGRVPMVAPDSVVNEFEVDQNRGFIAEDASLPQGYRSPLACEDPADVQWIFDPSLERADGDTVLTMQGDPSFNLVEVSCLLQDDGEFELSANEHLAAALEYASRKEAGGALFYFSRSNDLDAVVPAVRDQEGFRRDVEPIKIRAHSVEIGRFWYSGQGN
ncbi:MAG: hypothetical protein H6741_26285 [Alphaproteobacteria bacterium]|nr:hypothetical protein [Polyangiaceae bacterium]MCB9796217.1 hypothetical protein [Alphaproteobacteria bacterium]